MLVQILLLIIASAAMSLVALMVRKVFSGTPPFLLALVIWVVFVAIASTVTWDIVGKAHRATLEARTSSAESFSKDLDKVLQNAGQLERDASDSASSKRPSAGTGEMPLVSLFFGSFQALAGCIVIFIVPVVIAGTTMIRPVSTAGGNLLYQLQGEGVADGEASVTVERTDEERKVAAAQFPAVKTIESFTFRLQPGLNEALVRDLARSGFIDDHRNVILWGESGTGKTHLAIAIGVAACHHGKNVRFYSVNRLCQEILEHNASGTLERLFGLLERNDLLILDELGYVPVPQEAVEHLQALVERLRHRCSILLTTHLPLTNFQQAIGDLERAQAFADAIAKDAEVVPTHGETFRSQPAAKLINPVEESDPARLPEA